MKVSLFSKPHRLYFLTIPQAVIVEPLRPERFFVRTFNATSLYILSICEVCGSYQCPYCPFYSAAPPLLPSPNLAALLALALASWAAQFVLVGGASIFGGERQRRGAS